MKKVIQQLTMVVFVLGLFCSIDANANLVGYRYNQQNGEIYWIDFDLKQERTITTLDDMISFAVSPIGS